ncbi:hypothetical protein Tco_0380228, partial [Tanacetum coccineum]
SSSMISLTSKENGLQAETDAGLFLLPAETDAGGFLLPAGTYAALGTNEGIFATLCVTPPKIQQCSGIPHGVLLHNTQR